MTDMDGPQLEIEPRLIIRYLQHMGWKVEDYRSKLKRVSYNDSAGGEAVEIFFGDHASPEGKKRDVFFALNTISDFYDKTLELVSSDIRSLTFDLITSKIPNEYVLNDSIQLRVASLYINEMKSFLASSATTELTGERSFKRTKKEAIDYAEKCRFGHTFRGSFGFMIESPVVLNDAPTIPTISEKALPLGRRVVERIARGLSAYSSAVEEQNPSVIAQQPEGFSANMCDAMADIVEQTDVSKILLGIKLSPEWRMSENVPTALAFSVEAKHIELLREAAKVMRVSETPRPVTVFGRIKRLETDGNPADILEDPASREIEINWVNEENTIVHVKVMLTPQKYLEAVEAHKQGNAVSASGMLARVGRSWRLESVENFKVI